MFIPFYVTHLLNVGCYWWYKDKKEHKVTSTKLQIKDTEIFGSVQYREALHKCLITVCEEWCHNPVKEKKCGKWRRAIKSTSSKRCYIKIISYKTSHKDSLKRWELIIQKDRSERVFTEVCKDVD